MWEVLGVVIRDDPVEMTIRIDEDRVKVQCAADPQKKTRDCDKEYAAGKDRVKEKARVAAKDKGQDKDERKEFETCRESEKRGCECAAVAFDKDKHSQNGHGCKDAHLSPFETVQEGKRRQRQGNEEKLKRESGWDKSAEGEQVENDEEDLQNAPEEERSIESQRREYGEQDGDEWRIDKAFDGQFRLEDRLSHGIVIVCEVAKRLRAGINGGSEVVSVPPGVEIVDEEEERDQGGAKDEVSVLSRHR